MTLFLTGLFCVANAMNLEQDCPDGTFLGEDNQCQCKFLILESMSYFKLLANNCHSLNLFFLLIACSFGCLYCSNENFCNQCIVNANLNEQFGCTCEEGFVFFMAYD